MQADRAAHQFDQVAGDGEAEAGSLVAAGGAAVGLREFLEDFLLLVGSDADAGVLDDDQQAAGLFGVDLGPDADGAFFGELDGVADEVDQDLLGAVEVGVGEQFLGIGGADLEGEVQAGAGRLDAGEAFDLAQEFFDREVVDQEIHAAGLDAGDVEDVVNELEQVLGRGEGVGDVLALLLGAFAQALQDQLEEANDRVEGGAQLMAGIGEEFTLGLIGAREGLVHLFELFERGVQLVVLAPEQFLAGRHRRLEFRQLDVAFGLVRDVAEEEAEAVALGVNRVLEPACFALGDVGERQAVGIRILVACGEDLLERGIGQQGKEALEGEAEDLAGGAVQRAQGAAVGVGDVAGAVDRKIAFADDLQQRFHAGRAGRSRERLVGRAGFGLGFEPGQQERAAAGGIASSQPQAAGMHGAVGVEDADTLEHRDMFRRAREHPGHPAEDRPLRIIVDQLEDGAADQVAARDAEELPGGQVRVDDGQGAAVEDKQGLLAVAEGGVEITIADQQVRRG
ncbi:MAG: hypothetical protein BWZ08_02215 [candidate division BRC1 bacterium ADurb.BinA292]|nr:MAG: hypothetical protein BWZ08_02215 [candidate division BRC1 bacterium ADurb.BinA292]